MMRTPTEFELDRLLHYAIGYDPVAAREYYLRTRKLKGRRRGSAVEPRTERRRGSRTDPRTGKTRQQIARDARTKQRKLLTDHIQLLEKSLKKLDALIRKKAHEESREDRKGKAKKERASKERDKPKSAAEKAEAARKNEKYRDKHKQEIKSKEKKDRDKSGGGSSKSKVDGTRSESKKASLSELKTLRTRVMGQIAVAKQKLAAL